MSETPPLLCWDEVPPDGVCDRGLDGGRVERCLLLCLLTLLSTVLTSLSLAASACCLRCCSPAFASAVVSPGNTVSTRVLFAGLGARDSSCCPLAIALLILVLGAAAGMFLPYLSYSFAVIEAWLKLILAMPVTLSPLAFLSAFSFSMASRICISECGNPAPISSFLFSLLSFRSSWVIMLMGRKSDLSSIGGTNGAPFASVGSLSRLPIT